MADETQNLPSSPDDAAVAELPAEAVTEDVSVDDELSFSDMLMTVPDPIRRYLVSSELADTEMRIFSDAKLNEDEIYLVTHTILEVFFGDMDAQDFPDQLWARLPWKDEEEDRARALALDILGNVFLPAQAHLGDVATIIADLGGDIKKYPGVQIEVRRVQYTEGAKEIVHLVEGLDDEMSRRLVFIVESRLRAVRTDADVRAQMMKSKKTGGLEIDKDKADDIIALIAAKMRMTKYVESVTEGSGAASAKAPEISPSEIKKMYAGTPEEQQAIAKRLERFAATTEGDTEKMREAYYQLLYPSEGQPVDPLFIVAGLLALASDGDFPYVLEEDENFKNIMRLYLGDAARGAEGAAEVAIFEEKPTDLKFVNMFLQLVLRGFAGYDESESARFGLRVLKAADKSGKKKYAELVAFDMAKGSFAWTALV